MRLKMRRRVVYAATGLAVLALIGGYGLADLSLGTPHNALQQGSHTTTISGVAGLSLNETVFDVLEATVTNTTGCVSMQGCSVSSSGAVVCAGSTHSGQWCRAGDFVERVVLNTTAGQPFSGTVALTMYVIAGTVYTGETFYFYDSTGNARELITVDFDIGTATTGPAPVTSVTIIAQT